MGWTRVYINKSVGVPASPITYNFDHVVMLDVTERPDITTSSFPTGFIAGTGGRSVTQGLPYQPGSGLAAEGITVTRQVGDKLDEVVSVVAFLLSDEASYLTGVDIEIAGGAS